MHTDLKFFTNEPERDLYTRFATILKSNTQFFDILVGYFRSSGFFKLYESLENVEKIRVLVGLNVDKFTVKISTKQTVSYHLPVYLQLIAKKNLQMRSPKSSNTPKCLLR